MTYETLLAYIAPRLTKQTENVATDALLYLLRMYPVASKAFSTYIANLSVNLPKNLKYDTQLGLAGRAIPDLIGVDEDNHLVLLVESKFWATLTKNQPLAYLGHLTKEKQGIVLFIAPSSRFPTLWPELVQRCSKGGLSLGQQVDESPDYLVVEVEPGKRLGLVSWESLLTYLKQQLEANDVIDGSFEVWQLQGLCKRLDAEAFHPLLAEDLRTDSDAQIVSYHRLVDDLVNKLVEKEYASVKDYRATPGVDYYKRYMTLFGNRDWCIEFNRTHWIHLQRTPIWLTNATTQSIERVASLRKESPSRLFEDGKQILIPLDLLQEVEKEAVLDNLVDQIEKIEPFIGS